MSDNHLGIPSRLLLLMQEHSYQRKRVTLKSGRESDFYVDCRRTILSALGHYLIGHVIHHAIRSLIPDQSLRVGGVSIGADPMVSATSYFSFATGDPMDGFYIRKEVKGHGAKKQIDMAYSIKEGDAVVILEDVVTTGGSTIRAVEIAKQHGLDVKLVVALVDRQEDDGRASIEKVARFTSIFTREDFEE